jgi:hypothetical protein
MNAHTVSPLDIVPMSCDNPASKPVEISNLSCSERAVRAVSKAVRNLSFSLPVLL